MKAENMTKNTGWVSLANAIIVQACEDYRSALRMLQRARREQTNGEVQQKALAVGRIKMLEGFFTSEWFGELTNYDGAEIADKIRRQVDAEVIL